MSAARSWRPRWPAATTVTTLNRGISGHQPPGARARARRPHRPRRAGAARAGRRGRVLGRGDRHLERRAPGGRRRGRAAGRPGRALRVRVQPVGVPWPFPPGADESAPVVDADPASDDGDDYAAAKRGGELAAVAGVRRPGAAGPGRPHPRAVRERRADALVAAAPGARRRRAGPRPAGPAAAVHRLPGPGRVDALGRRARDRRCLQHGQPARSRHDGQPARGGPGGDRVRTPRWSGCRRR